MLLLLTLLALTGPISGHLNLLRSYGGGQMISWEPRTMISSQDYPCPEEGFYQHPFNCSRFYRCVDFTNESEIFSRYLFECPEGEVWAHTIETCVPGVCPQAVDASPDGGEGPVEQPTDVVGPEGEAEPDIVQGVVGASVDEGAGIDPGVGEEAVVPEPEPGVDGGHAGPDAEDSGAGESQVQEGLPPVVQHETNVMTPAGEVECSQGTYVQHAQFCNLFHLCNDEGNIFSCYEGTAFSPQHQMCRLSQTGTEESYCDGKEVFIPSAESFRNAFQWEEVGVIPYLENPVYNANPFVFTNLRSASPVSNPTSDLKRSQIDAKVEKVDEKKTSSKGWRDGFDFKSLFDVFNRARKSSSEKNLEKKSLDKSSQNVYLDASAIEDPNNYEYVVVPGYSQTPYDPYSYLNERSINSIADLYSLYPSSAYDYTIPVFQDQGLTKKSESRPKSSNPFEQLAQIAPAFQPSRSSPSVGIIMPSPYPQALRNMYSSQLSLPYSPYGSSPFMPYRQALYPQQASAPYSIFASPYGYIMAPNYGIGSVGYPSFGSGFPSTSWNPYSNVKIDQKQIENLLRSTLNPMKKSSVTSNRLLSNKNSGSYFPSSQSNLMSALEARNDEGETYQVIPLTDNDIMTLAQQGLLDRATMVNKPVTYEDVRNLKDGEVLLASLKK